MFPWDNDPDVDVLTEDVTEEETKESNSIVLYNDDVNSFQHVIECLVKYCRHNPHQAEQCATIVHFNGKCSVKDGSYDDLKPICEALLENQLRAKIE
jgi:ATP-dependent Clp protease adaptor protein ClpS